MATLAFTASAQDGGQLYETYCGACHAANGEGATGGQFPPLAGSEWVDGPAERAIQIILHGLEGPVEVSGKPFNLLMPPQGAMLPDDQIAAILTYVRSSWGNSADKVTPAMVAKARAATAERSKPWTAPEILKLHPLPKPESPLRNLTSRVYHGEWKKLPEFAKLTAENVEEEHDGILSVTHADRKDHFGIVWEADFMVPKTGEYIFRFACDDGGRIILDGEVMLEVHGLGPIGGGRTQAAKLTLEKGPHPIRIEYYEYTGQEGISISWKGPDSDDWNELSDTKLKPGRKGPPSIPITPTAERAAIYRNFIKGTTSRSIGIGFPGGVNFAYSADHMAPELVWKGDFIDGGLHWTNRGVGAQSPAGKDVVKLTSGPALPEGSRFRGYQLDAAGNPTFASLIDFLALTDHYWTHEGTLKRRITTKGVGDPVAVQIATSDCSLILGSTEILEGKSAPSPPYNLKLDGPITLAMQGGLALRLSAPAIRSAEDGYYLLLAPGESATLTYTWK